MAEAFWGFLSLFRGFFAEPKTLAVFGFVTLFTLAACAFGLASRVLSPEARRNTLASLATLGVNLLLAPVIYVLSDAFARAHARLDLPVVPASLWEGVWFPLVVIAALLAKDFADYWVHRALHQPLLWPIHAVHHSDTHVNGFTSFRVHALELVLMNAFYVTLLTWLGLPPGAIAVAHLLAALHNSYIHFEVDIDHGPFNWVLASPRFHRWHHADNPEVYGKNLANLVPLYDRLFGTYHAGGACHERMGLERDGIPGTDPALLVALPFRLWAKGLARWAGDRLSRPGPRVR